MLTADHIQRFMTNGFVRGTTVLSAQEVADMQAEIARVIKDAEAGSSRPQPVLCRNLSGDAEHPVWQIVNIWEASPAFQALIHKQVIAEEIAQLTGATQLRLWHDQIQYKPAETGGVNHWHQDAPLWPILAPMTEVSAWVALDDVDESNGCMVMVPGSHLWGNNIAFLNTLQDIKDMPQEFEGHKIEVRPCPVGAGEVHYHHALTWHGSGPNTSGRPRRAIALHYMTNETRYVASGDHVMKRFVEVSDGEVMTGEHFPLVWETMSAAGI